MKYRYEFEKGSKKHYCPKCGKRTFVRYVDNETGEYLPLEFGRCDRENNCGYWGTPKGEHSNSYEVNFTPPPPTSYHDPKLIIQSGRNFKENNFIQFLKTIFNEDEVKQAILKYCIGTSKHWAGANIFWQIDNKNNIRHGKVMLYDGHTGKRSKSNEGRAFINSVRSIQKLRDFNLKQCLFGLHLINEMETRTVAITEGEKTAIIMSIFKPEYIWMATGSKQGFKYEMLKPIKEFNVIAFPDKSEYYDWQAMAIELNGYGFKITVNDWMEKQTQYAKGSDLADVYLDEMEKPQRPKAMQTHNRPTTEIKSLVISNLENSVNRMAQRNPNLWLLIDQFGLTDGNGNQLRKCIIT